MFKILCVIDGLKYSDSSVAYAIDFAKRQPSHIVGLFLDDFTHHSYRLSQVLEAAGQMEEVMHQLDHRDEETRLVASARFTQQCENAGVSFSVRHDKNIALQELLHESIYADLLIIDRKETFNSRQEPAPTRFLSELLSDVHCPVMVVPGEFYPIAQFCLLYDGSPVSVYAVKTFAHLFPNNSSLPVELISVSREKQPFIPDKRLMKELAKRHYPEAVFTLLKGDAEHEILSALRLKQKDTLVVVGAYQRSSVSRWFKASMADVIMEHSDLPLFIAHD